MFSYSLCLWVFCAGIVASRRIPIDKEKTEVGQPEEGNPLEEFLRNVDLEISNPSGNVQVARRQSRMKRQTSSTSQQFLDAHNDARSKVSPQATNMVKMKWSNELAQVAQDYANKCVWGHNSARTTDAKALTSQFYYVGENLYVTSSSSVDPASAVTSWDNEKKDYTYSTQACSGVCGHYTQVVWAGSEYLGCATKTCSSISGLSWKNGGTIVVCNYGQGGNFNGAKPYVSGSTCSSCPSGYSCNNNLCDDGSSSTSSGSTSNNSGTSGSDSASTGTDSSESSGSTGQTSAESSLLFCGFEDGEDCFLQNYDNDDFDFTLRSGCTPSSSTGPSGAKSGSKYAYIEASSPRTSGQTAFLLSNYLPSSAKCVTFSYNMYGSTMGSLKLYQYTNEGSYQALFSKTGDQGSGWKTTSVSLAQGTNSYIYFVGVVGSSFRSDAAIDDVSITAEAC